MSRESSREWILRAVRTVRPAAVALPDVQALWQPHEPPAAARTTAFTEAAQRAGATVHVTSRAGLTALAASMALPGGVIVSVADGVTGTSPMPPEPNALATTDLLVCDAMFGVAENGAVWLPGSGLGHRAGIFLALHVLVVLPHEAIVTDMHAAYARLDLRAEAFGVFVAGPSKTADIEQSLVVGAHGPKGLSVALLTPD